MKTYKDLLKQDYDYLDSLRYGISKTFLNNLINELKEDING